MNFSLTLPAMLAIPLVGIVLIALGTRPKATAVWVSLLNLIPGFLASGVVLRSGELLFGPDPIPARRGAGRSTDWR